MADGVQWINDQLAIYFRTNPGKTRTKLTKEMVRQDRAKYHFLKAKDSQARSLSHFCLVLANVHAGHGARAALQLESRFREYSAEYRRLVVELFDGDDRVSGRLRLRTI